MLGHLERLRPFGLDFSIVILDRSSVQWGRLVRGIDRFEDLGVRSLCFGEIAPSSLPPQKLEQERASFKHQILDPNPRSLRGRLQSLCREAPRY
ncbi:hypothetical protein J5N97_016958 [Dioscorea zingiberensis]|uniref:Uncharacterized protein n=1 Tax=Dioscorea zingiberensis TaxID=325984 RepID=A0A9D5CMB6_9LILI|nr:hypothetical protein J5N97_016958 [Dioscorea zingiberensis]